ncbi:MAG: HIT family protein [Butyribacter sp.]|nr:HIT family protein [bacterium]MDY3853833.1 HIT family protein [Butyribacter sp.]
MKKVVNDDCIFCKLANGVIPTNAIYEDDDFKVIMDANPASKGHCIILPKTHAANLYELPDEYCEKIFLVAKKCGTVLKEVLECEGLNVLQNNGEVAGQTVFHLHVHLIPRYKDDAVHIKWVEHSDETDIAELAEEIRKGF